MFCTKCGNQIKDGFKFCPKCGAPVYVEKGSSQSDVKAQEKVVKEETSKKEPEIKKVDKAKNAAKTQAASSSKKSSESKSSKQDYIPNPLIAEELNIEGVKKKAEQGNKDAMLRQAFRYEMGIGVKINKEKSEELYSLSGGNIIIPEIEEILRSTIIPSDY